MTLLAGVFTTAVACFPFVFTRLLDFVGLYGVLLMPIGAIVLVEHYLFPKIGLTRYWFSHTGRVVNWPALLAWFGAVGLACYLHFAGIVHLFFVPLPIWFLTAAAYTVLCMFCGAKSSVHFAARGQSIETESAAFHSAARADAESTTDEPYNSQMFSIIGIVALLALVTCVALPLWVLVTESSPYAERLASYRIWLAWASVTHLLTCAIWVMKKVR